MWVCVLLCVCVCGGVKCVKIRRGHRGHEFDRKNERYMESLEEGEGREKYIIILYSQKIEGNYGQNSARYRYRQDFH